MNGVNRPKRLTAMCFGDQALLLNTAICILGPARNVMPATYPPG